MSFRDTLVQLGFVMIALGASFATWALLTGPLGRYTGLGSRVAPRRPRAARARPPDATPGAPRRDPPGAPRRATPGVEDVPRT